MAANRRSSGGSGHENVRLAAATGRRWPLPWSRPTGSGGVGRLRTAFLDLALVCCSPVLLPLAYLSSPLLCLAGLCFRLGRSKTMECQREPESASATERRLLHRYLEDQLGLVGGGLAVDLGGGGVVT